MRRAPSLFFGVNALIRTLLLAACIALPAAAHRVEFTPAENEWLNRQRAVDGTKCCDETDAHVGLSVEWRITGGRYQLRIAGAWVDVPPGRIMRHDPADPSPWPGEALAFYTLSPFFPGGFRLWCFRPEALH